MGCTPCGGFGPNVHNATTLHHRSQCKAFYLIGMILSIIGSTLDERPIFPFYLSAGHDQPCQKLSQNPSRYNHCPYPQANCTECFRHEPSTETVYPFQICLDFRLTHSLIYKELFIRHSSKFVLADIDAHK